MHAEPVDDAHEEQRRATFLLNRVEQGPTLLAREFQTAASEFQNQPCIVIHVDGLWSATGGRRGDVVVLLADDDALGFAQAIEHSVRARGSGERITIEPEGTTS